jgi:flagellar biosynthesis/type III secretory pathway chaperone
VKSESEHYLGLLDRRLSLLDSLAKTLAEARADFISLDLEAIHGRIRDQQQFCAQIQALDKDITSAQVRCANLSSVRPRVNEISWPDLDRPDEGAGEKIRAAMRRIATAQAELKRLNDAHQALLRRSRRSVGILLNLFQSHAPTYAGQPAPHAGTLCEERV